MMTTEIPYLKPGDLIRIVSPAKAIENELLTHAKNVLEAAGFRVKIGKNAGNRWNYFSGTDSERLADMQEAINDPECKAILCARGGYGCVRIVGLINWAGFLRAPKWMIGFSDVTVFHHHIQRFNIPSIHATMPLNFKENTQEALNSLVAAISGTKNEYRWQTNTSKSGEVEGKVIGGNLSIIYSLLGTDDQLHFENSILFIEDLSEQLYALDRMFHSLSKAGVFDKITGLIVGGMTNMKDTEPPTGFSLSQIIMDHFTFRNIPIAFDFPAGHIEDNRAIVLGRLATFRVTKDSAIFSQ